MEIFLLHNIFCGLQIWWFIVGEGFPLPINFVECKAGGEILGCRLGRRFCYAEVSTGHPRPPLQPSVNIDKSQKRNGNPFLFVIYSLRSATMGSFLAALFEGIIPAKRVKITLMAIRIIATGRGRIALRFAIPVK